MKGGEDEIESKKQQVSKLLEQNNEDVNSKENQDYLRRKRYGYKLTIEHPKYIIYDFEADVHTLTHLPNHVEADVLKIGETHSYDESKQSTFSYNGYDAVGQFCNWLFTDENSNSTVIAHNQAGYDGRFILQWCLKKGLHPEKYIRQGSRIMYMEFKKIRIRFIDSYHFFLEP